MFKILWLYHRINWYKLNASMAEYRGDMIGAANCDFKADKVRGRLRDILP